MAIDRPDEDDAPDVTLDTLASHDSAAEVEHTDNADLRAAQAACKVELRATVEAVYRAAWDDAVLAFRRAWEEHKARYPHPERSRPAVQDDGSWRGEGALRLSPEQNAAVDSRHDQFRETGKDVVLPRMERLEAEDPERHLAGLGNFIKRPDRLKEKVANDVLFKGRTEEQSLENIKDAVRFTFVYADERYTEGVYSDCARLEAVGFEPFDRQNSWQHDQYKGINSRWREPESGLLFEVQFHTQASFAAKELTHQAYERLRGSAADDAEREQLEAFQSAVCAMIPVPPRAPEIEDYSPEKRDG